MIITLIIYTIIFLLIFFKTLYKSLPFMKSFLVRKNFLSILTTLQIESLPFFFNQQKINLLIFFF